MPPEPNTPGCVGLGLDGIGCYDHNSKIDGDVVQLEERLRGTQKVTSSNLVVSIPPSVIPVSGRYDFPVPTITQAIERLLLAKKNANLRPKYLNSLRQYLTMFAKGREEIPIESITVEHLEEWFISRSEPPISMRSNLGRLSALFSFCWRRKWIPENPCHFLEKPRVDHRSPQIFSVEECIQILDFTCKERPDALGIIVLGLFVGLRPEESVAVSWRDIDTDEGVIRIDAIASKVRQRRLVQPMPNAVEWLEYAREIGAELPMRVQRRRRFIRRLREHMGLKRWPQDVLRHCCASFWMAQIQDAGKVAAQLGNSSGVLLRHYRQLVSRADAERFWAIRPHKEHKEDNETTTERPKETREA